MAKNVYIHIPFCKGGKCNYCSFVSYPEIELKEKYLDALAVEIKQSYKGEALETLYFGGGTPSVLSTDEFNKIISLFKFAPDAEITTEINPNGIDENYLQGLKDIGINRISIGSQTFDDEILKLIGRKHNSEQIKNVVNSAQKVGFDNISLDFIYGLPTQNIDGFEEDLKTAVSLEIQHVSLYGLKIEEGCFFYDNMPAMIPDGDMQADMYLKAIEVLKNEGFEHYEISNFSLTNFNSRHNLNYWENNTYYGFGCAASGYIDGIRYTNEVDLEKYLAKYHPHPEFLKLHTRFEIHPSPLKGEGITCIEQKLPKQEILEEAIFLGFRKIAGINVEEINKKYDINFDKKYAKILEKYLSTEHIIKTEKGYALSTEGILVSNEILSEFIEL